MLLTLLLKICQAAKIKKSCESSKQSKEKKRFKLLHSIKTKINSLETFIRATEKDHSNPENVRKT